MKSTAPVHSTVALAAALVAALLAAAAVSTPASPTAPAYRLLQAGGISAAKLKKLSDFQINQLKQAGVNVEQEKILAVGKQAAARANLYYDPATREVYVYAGNGEPQPTGLALGGGEALPPDAEVDPPVPPIEDIPIIE